MSASGERLLWICVLGEQLNLALRGKDPMHLKGDSEMARRWIGTRDFRLVCHYAQLDPNTVERWAKDELAKPVEERRLEMIGLRSVSAGMSEVRNRRSAPSHAVPA